MRRIFKYQLSSDLAAKDVCVEIHRMSRFLSVGWQDGEGIVAWYEVDVDKQRAPESRMFYIVWTGGVVPSIDDPLRPIVYRGTGVRDLVCHIYEGPAE